MASRNFIANKVSYLAALQQQKIISRMNEVICGGTYSETWLQSAALFYCNAWAETMNTYLYCLQVLLYEDTS